VRTDQGTNGLLISESFTNFSGRINVFSNGEFQFRDIPNSQTVAAVYTGTPGSLELPNAELKLSHAAELQPTTTPSTPASGWKLFSDSADGEKLKAIDAAGNVTTIVS